MTVDITKNRHSVVFIVLVVLFDAIGYGIILPVMPGLIMSLSGSELSEASRLGGYVMFVFAVVHFFAGPILGNLGDRYGRRPVLLFTLLVLGLGYVLMATAQTLFWLFVARFIAGAASSTFAVAYAYIIDVTAVEMRAQRFGIVGAAFGLGFALGPVIGGLLAGFGDRVPFIVAALLALLNLLYGYFVLGESLTATNRRRFDIRRANPLGAIMQLRRYPLILGMALAYFLFMIGQLAMPSYWAYFAIAKFNWSEAEIGYSFGFAGITAIVSQGFILGLVVRRVGPIKTAILGFSAALVAYTGYAFIWSGWQMYLLIALGSFAGFVVPAFQTIMSGQVPDTSQGELQGALSCLNSIALVLGPIIMTQLFFIFTRTEGFWNFPGISFLATAALTALCLFIFLMTVRQVQLPSPLPALRSTKERLG